MSVLVVATSALKRDQAVLLRKCSQSHSWFSTLLLATILSLCMGLPCAADTQQGCVTHVIDGDTIKVILGSREVTVRLWGIDSPEWQQPYSQQAKRYTRKRLQDKCVVVTPKYYDKYGRMVALVYRGTVSFNEELVTKGLGWVHIYYCNEEICDSWRRLEHRARENHLGLWRQRSPMPPWQWKRIHR